MRVRLGALFVLLGTWLVLAALAPLSLAQVCGNDTNHIIEVPSSALRSVPGFALGSTLSAQSAPLWPLLKASTSPSPLVPALSRRCSLFLISFLFQTPVGSPILLYLQVNDSVHPRILHWTSRVASPPHPPDIMDFRAFGFRVGLGLGLGLGFRF